MLTGIVSFLIATLVWYLLPTSGPSAVVPIDPKIAAAAHLIVGPEYGAKLRELGLSGPYLPQSARCAGAYRIPVLSPCVVAAGYMVHQGISMDLLCAFGAQHSDAAGHFAARGPSLDGPIWGLGDFRGGVDDCEQDCGFVRHLAPRTRSIFKFAAIALFSGEFCEREEKPGVDVAPCCSMRPHPAQHLEMAESAGEHHKGE